MEVVNKQGEEVTGERKTFLRKRIRVPAICIAIVLLIVLVALFTLGNRNFLSAYNLNTIASYAAILLVVGLGQMCTILVGGIDLSVGGLMSFISVVFVFSTKSVGAWAFPICLFIGLIAGYINGNILTRIKIPSFIATLGTGGILTSLALLVSPLPVDVPASGYGLLDVVNGASFGLPNLLLLTIAVFAVFFVILRFTKVGRNIYYSGSNIKMSWMSGIDVTGTRNIAFLLSGFAASVAAIMQSCSQFGGDPTLGKVYILQSIAAVVVGGTALTGGTGGTVNTLIGALILAVMENGMNVVGVDAYFQQSILGAVIIVSVALTFDRSKTVVIK
ncbi:MAG TPA: ABC transporter permease [Chthoniobacterales bacterium]|jgi:ribose/xylose/arabinose/galactoside ABC-type transport system permease subunit|nr:ABC transporter permease [Chthoniobacterales bacterium]